MIDPTAYQDGRRFRNIQAYNDVLHALLLVRKAMPDTLYDDREKP